MSIKALEFLESLSNPVFASRDTPEGKRGGIYSDGDLVVSFMMEEGNKMYIPVVINGEDFVVDIEMEDPEVGVYTVFLMVKDCENINDLDEIGISPSTWVFDASDPANEHNPFVVSRHWNVTMRVETTVAVNIVGIPPINRDQAEAKARKALRNNEYIKRNKEVVRTVEVNQANGI
jgi:hypothetical protein